MFYIIIMCLAILLLLPLKKHKNDKIGKICYILSFVVSFLPAGLRYGIGTDYFYTYVPYFEWIGNGTKEFTEIGFNLLNKIIYELFGDYKVMFFVTAFVILALIYKAIWDNSDDVLQGVILLFVGQVYFYSMNIVRQAMAMAIILYAFKYFKDKNYIKTLIFVLIASLFHTSALIMIPIFFVCTLDIKYSFKIISLISLILFEPLILKIVIWLISFTKYSWYFNEGMYIESISILLVLQNLFIFLIEIYYQRKYKNELSNEYKCLSNINFIGMCMMVFSSHIPLVYRLVRYCTFFQILFVPKVLSLANDKKNKLVITLLLLVFMFACMIYQIIICGGEEVYPYTSIFGR